jgi:hypothetical protein
MADGVVWVQSCADADFDASTMTCAAPIWTPQASALPTLTIDAAQTIGMSIALLWATAWGLKQCRLAVERIG